MPTRRPPYPPGRPLPCCVDVPDALVESARHGLEVLVVGLGLEPVWTDHDDLPPTGLYYGAAPESARSAVRMRLDPGLTEAEWPAVDPSTVSSLEWGGAKWPLLYPRNRAFGPPGGEVEEADIVASAHAWTSGRLEQQVRRRDVHGRLRDDDAPPAIVAAARADLADGSRRPVVDAYRRWLAAALERAGIDVPGRTWRGHAWALIPTVDVDLVRTRRPSAALGNDPRRRALAHLASRLTSDDRRATFFLKAGDTGRYDVDYPLDHPSLDPVWQAARAGRAEIALHPSYFAHDHARRIRSELALLQAAAAHSDTQVSPVVRTHYLRWIEPGTPRALASSGRKRSSPLRIDSSIGFSGRAGFRRATALPYRLFDVLAGRPLDLWEIPLAVMDTALFVHGVPGGDAAIDEAIAGAREAAGACVLLWHNEPRGRAAVRALDEALRTAREDGALIDGLLGAIQGWAPPPPLDASR